MTKSRLSLLLKLGVILTVVATLDPMEGSIVILAGIAIAAFAAAGLHNLHRLWLYTGLVLTTIGVSALWGLSAVGGFGGDSGRSMWWGLSLLPYPIGWVVSVIGGVRAWRDLN